MNLDQEIGILREQLRLVTEQRDTERRVVAEQVHAISVLREELDDWETLAALQRTREQPWFARWQAETGKPTTLPDYGEFLGWLVGRLDDAYAAIRALEASAALRSKVSLYDVCVHYAATITKAREAANG